MLRANISAYDILILSKASELGICINGIVQYIKILQKAEQWQRLDIGQNLNTQNATYVLS